MWKTRITALVLLLVGFSVAFFVYKTEPNLKDSRLSTSWVSKVLPFNEKPFKLGLDLSGGSHLVYKADTSALSGQNIKDSMDSLRDIIERRVNLFGVSEPVVQIEQGGIGAGGEQKLIVDLPGITDVEKAVAMIGQTPLLEFRIKDTGPQNATVLADGSVSLNVDENFIPTELTGRFLDRATLEFDQTTMQPKVSLKFNKEGTDLFAKMTGENVGKIIAIYLDGAPISTPVVNEAITTGEAVISGNFKAEEAKLLVGRLNSGALPVPITLISTQTIGPSLGEKAVDDGVKAALIGFLIVALFLILWYRLPGLIAVISLMIYAGIMLSLFKLVPVVLTAAGLAGFIISIGIAVDANVLIFERVKEELKNGRTISDAVSAGFSRAWFSIRDSNISSFITAVILFWFGTSLIKGFALTLGMGVLVSMLSAITLTQIFLKSINFFKDNKFTRFLFSSGLSK